MKDIAQSGKREIVDYFGIPVIRNPYLPRASDSCEIDKCYIRSLCESAGRSGNIDLVEYLNSVVDLDCSAVATGAIMGGYVSIFYRYLDRYHKEQPTETRYCDCLDTDIKYQCNDVIPYFMEKIDERERHFVHRVIYRVAKCNRRDIVDTILSKNIHTGNDINLGLWGASVGNTSLTDFFIEKGVYDLVGALNVCIEHYPKTKALATVDYLIAKIKQSIPDFDFQDVINIVIERGDTNLFRRFRLGDLDLIRDPRSRPYYVVMGAIRRHDTH